MTERGDLFRIEILPFVLNASPSTSVEHLHVLLRGALCFSRSVAWMVQLPSLTPGSGLYATYKNAFRYPQLNHTNGESLLWNECQVTRKLSISDTHTPKETILFFLFQTRGCVFISVHFSVVSRRKTSAMGKHFPGTILSSFILVARFFPAVIDPLLAWLIFYTGISSQLLPELCFEFCPGLTFTPSQTLTLIIYSSLLKYF